MAYTIEFEKDAKNSLLKLPKNISSVAKKKIEALAQDPYARNNNALKLQGRSGYRLRVGNLRIFYEIVDNKLVIVIVDIKFRGGAYQ